MNAFELRRRLIDDYSEHVGGFVRIGDARVAADVHVLIELAGAAVNTVDSRDRAARLAALLASAEPSLERQWLHRVDELGLRLPDVAQRFVSEEATHPNFTYTNPLTAIYVDGPKHAVADRARRDRDREARLTALGYAVLRFSAQTSEWDEIFAGNAVVFGRGTAPPPATGAVPARSGCDEVDLDLFPEVWHPVVTGLVQRGVALEAGSAVAAIQGHLEG